MRILSTSAAALIAPVTISMPRPAYGEGERDVTDPNVQVGIDDKLPDDEAPDFSFLGGDDAVPVEKNITPKPPVEEPKPPASTPVTVKDIDPIEEVPPLKPNTDAPDFDNDAEKQRKEADAATQKAKDDAKAKEDAEKAKAGKPPEPPAEVKLPTDEEVDAMVPKPGAPRQVVESFQKLKAEVVKPALAEVKRLKAELEDTRKKITETPALTPDLQAKLTQAEEDRAWREAFELENDPKLQEEFKGKTTKAEDALFALLRDHPSLKMKPESIEALKKMGLDSELGQTNRKKILEAVKKLDDDMLFDEVKDAFKARDRVAKEQAERVAELRGKQGPLTELKAAREKEERMAWGGEIDQHVIKLVATDPDTFFKKDLPENATAEQKKAIEEHNTKLEKELVPKMQQGFRDLYLRNPEKTAEMLIASVRLPKVEQALTDAKAALEKAQARIAELEEGGTRLRRVTGPSTKTGAPATPPTKAPTSTAETSDDAFDEFAREKGLSVGHRNG